MINVILGANSLTGLISSTFVDMGLNSLNTAIIYKIAGTVIKSWKPGRSINGITNIEAEGQYYFVALQNMDLTEFFSPPLPEGGSEVVIIEEESDASFTDEITQTV